MINPTIASTGIIHPLMSTNIEVSELVMFAVATPDSIVGVMPITNMMPINTIISPPMSPFSNPVKLHPLNLFFAQSASSYLNAVDNQISVLCPVFHHDTESSYPAFLLVHSLEPCFLSLSNP